MTLYIISLTRSTRSNEVSPFEAIVAIVWHSKQNYLRSSHPISMKICRDVKTDDVKGYYWTDSLILFTSRDNKAFKINLLIYFIGVSQMVMAHDLAVCGRHLPYIEYTKEKNKKYLGSKQRDMHHLGSYFCRRLSFYKLTCIRTK